MREKLIHYVNGLFAHAPSTAQVKELHDEILQNTLDRYDDELASGRPEREAYDAAVAAIGDVESLLKPLCPKKHTVLLRALAVCCCILAILPPVLLQDERGAAGLFLLAAVGTVLFLLSANGGQTASGRLRVGAIGLFVLSVIPPVLLSDRYETLGVAGMIVTIAAASVLLVISNSKKEQSPQTEPQTVAAAIAEKNAPPRLPVAVRIVIALLWVAASVTFAWMSVLGYWFYAWALFPFTGAVTDVLRGVVLLFCGKRGGKYLIDGILWLVIVQIYWAVTARTGAWYLTWIVMPLGAFAGGVVHGIMALIGGRGGTGKAVTKIVLCSVFGLILCGIFSGILMMPKVSEDNLLTLPVLRELRESYRQENGYCAGSATIEAEIDGLDLSWGSGSVVVTQQEIDGIRISADKDEEALLWKVKDGTLYVRRKRSWANLFGSLESSDTLRVVLPEGSSFSRTEISAASAEVELNDFVGGELSVDTASGDVTMTSCELDSLKIDTASGNCVLEECNVEQFDMDTASGNVSLDGALTEIRFDSASGDLTVTTREAPRTIDVDSVSGNCKIRIPENSGFTATLDSLSGDLLTSGFRTALVGGSYVCGDGSAEYRFESVSGDVEVTSE